MRTAIRGAHFFSDELLLRWIQRLRRDRFFGRTVLSWENGQVVCVKAEETLNMQDIEKKTAKHS